MKVQVFLLEFKAEGGIFFPRDPELHKLAVEYKEKNFSEPEKVNFTDYRNLWVAAEVNEQGKPVRVLGLLGMVYRPDFQLVRFTDNAAVVKLVQRANDFLHDQGARGAECFVRIADNEPPEWRCIDWEKWIAALGLTKSERYSITVK